MVEGGKGNVMLPFKLAKCLWKRGKGRFTNGSLGAPLKKKKKAKLWKNGEVCLTGLVGNGLRKLGRII